MQRDVTERRRIGIRASISGKQGSHPYIGAIRQGGKHDGQRAFFQFRQVCRRQDFVGNFLFIQEPPVLVHIAPGDGIIKRSLHSSITFSLVATLYFKRNAKDIKSIFSSLPNRAERVAACRHPAFGRFLLLSFFKVPEGRTGTIAAARLPLAQAFVPALQIGNGSEKRVTISE